MDRKEISEILSAMVEICISMGMLFFLIFLCVIGYAVLNWVMDFLF